MAGILARAVFRTAGFAVKYVVLPIAYTAFLGYLMQEAADRVRPEEAKEEDPPFDPTLQPSR